MYNFYIDTSEFPGNGAVEICYGNARWARIFKEKDALAIKFYAYSENVRRYPLEDVLKIFDEAKKMFPISGNSVETGGDQWRANDGVFPNLTGDSPQQINEQGQAILEGILNDPNQRVYKLSDGSLKIYASNGRGVFFKKGESLRGFIEKKYEENSLSLELCSDLDFEGMVVDVTYNGVMTVASINYDKGINDMEVEFFPFGYGDQKMILSLQNFVDILGKARQLAENCAEEDKERGNYGF